jgi:hypothetical protein
VRHLQAEVEYEAEDNGSGTNEQASDGLI